jgi:hypothetical protein
MHIAIRRNTDLLRESRSSRYSRRKIFTLMNFPGYHQATDRYTSYSDKDFRLGLNAAHTTLGAIAQLTGATLK